MTVEPCPDANALAALADDSASVDDRVALEAHLDRCVTCSQVMAELGGLVAGGLVPGAPPGYRVVHEAAPGQLVAETRDGDRVMLHVVEAGGVDIAAAADRARAVGTLAPAGVQPIVEVVVDEHRLVIATSVPVGLTARAFGTPARDRAEIAKLWRDALAIVATLHAAGVAHDGISPDAVTIADGRVMLGAAAVSPEEPAYRAPELRGPHAVAPSARSDQFALCVAIWEGLTGRRPYSGVTPGALAVTMQSPLALPDHDRAVFAALRRGLSPDPTKRWPDLDALARALDDMSRGSPTAGALDRGLAADRIRHRAASVAIALVVVVAIAVVGAIVVLAR